MENAKIMANPKESIFLIFASSDFFPSSLFPQFDASVLGPTFLGVVGGDRGQGPHAAGFEPFQSDVISQSGDKAEKTK